MEFLTRWDHEGGGVGSDAFCAVLSRTLEVDPPMEVLPHSLGTREQVRRGADGDAQGRQARQGEGLARREGRSGRWAQCRAKIIKTNDLMLRAT